MSPTDTTASTGTDTTTNTVSDSLTFLSTICGKLKRIKRTGWVRSNVPLPESDSDHMHRCCMCAMLVTTQPADPRDVYSDEDGDGTGTGTAIFHPSKIDGVKLLRMAVTHDLCESMAGDVTPFCHKDAIASKHENEEAAMEEIRRVVGDPLGVELYELWKEYEDQKTPEALYCKDIDKFEMVMQAFEYEDEHLQHREHDSKDIDILPTLANMDENKKDDDTIFCEPLRTFFITTNSSMKSPLFRRLDAELRHKREKMLNARGWEVTEEERQQYK